MLTLIVYKIYILNCTITTYFTNIILASALYKFTSLMNKLR